MVEMLIAEEALIVQPSATKFPAVEKQWEREETN
jgi:hypothetical protein